MKVVMVSSEALPYAKTGGLADVCGALPRRLAGLGHRCSVFLPGYSRAIQSGRPIEDTHVGFVIDMAGRRMAARVLRSPSDESGVDFYFIDQPHYFDRPQLYGDHHGDYSDNCERFAFFNRAVVQAIDRLSLFPDIVHCHDWQAGLVPAYVKTNFGGSPWYANAGVVMTIHNLAYQGRYWVHDMHLTGLDWKYFNSEHLEFYNDVCFLKSGIVFSDVITTVSPSYAEEIRRPEFGCGLDGVLNRASDRLVGIVNGVDYAEWDPLHDRYLTQSYSVENWRSGKATAKQNLQAALGLPHRTDVPLVGLIGRLAGQKGWDLVIPTLENWLPNRDVQWAVLGSGEYRFQEALTHIASRYPDKVAAKIEFSDRLAHQIEAAADIFLMPSQYEPCGLNQLYSLRYGAVPVVHAVGGLRDTVTHASRTHLDQRVATGFAFHDYSVQALGDCLNQAIEMFHRDPESWASLVENGMAQDWSWNKSAQEYEAVYRRALEQKSQNA